MKNKIIWYLKQLLPLTYWSFYTENNIKVMSIWKMWLGKVYNHRKWIVKKEVDK